MEWVLMSPGQNVIIWTWNVLSRLIFPILTTYPAALFFEATKSLRGGSWLVESDLWRRPSNVMLAHLFPVALCTPSTIIFAVTNWINLCAFPANIDNSYLTLWQMSVYFLVVCLSIIVITVVYKELVTPHNRDTFLFILSMIWFTIAKL